jgi:hypothetical protein
LVLSAIPVVSGFARAAKRAHAAVEGVEAAEHLVVRAGLSKIGKELGEEGADVHEGFIRVLGKLEDDAAKQALTSLVKKFGMKARTARALERAGERLGYERLVILLAKVDARFGQETTERLIRVLDSLKLPPAAALKIGDEALEGMAVWLSHAAAHGWQVSRVKKMWHDIQVAGAALGPEQQLERLNSLFRWILEGEAKGVKGWVDFIGKGGGTLAVRSTTGMYNVLEHLADIKWQNVVELERGVGKRTCIPWLGGQRCWFERYIDIVLSDPVKGEIFRELKNLKDGARFGFGGEALKDLTRALEAAQGPNGYNKAELIAQLSRIEYYLRGSSQQMDKVLRGLRGKIERTLADANLGEYARHVVTHCQEKALPF